MHSLERSLRRSALSWALIIAVVLSGAALITFAAANTTTCEIVKQD